MNLTTNLNGRLRNTNLPKSNVLFPLYEAVVNAVHSIDDRIQKESDFDLENAFIKIKIRYSDQGSLEGEFDEIVGFTIIDNGIGFNEDNYDSFQTLDSTYKIRKGCRGVGRLLWLKAFESVSIHSVYRENDVKCQRSFNFNGNKNIFGEEKQENVTVEMETSVELKDLKKAYQLQIPKKASTIARALLEHCLWYFLRDGGAPSITLESNENESEVSLNDIYDSYIERKIENGSFLINSHSFDITHVRLKNCTIKNEISYGAADRVVKSEPLTNKIPGLFGTLIDGEESFNYRCFLSSNYLTEHVSSERLDFNIPEDGESMFEDDLSFSKIRTEAIKHIQEHLSPYLKKNKDAGKKRLRDFIDTKAPRYRALLKRLPEEEQVIDPNITDKDLDLFLYKKLAIMECETITTGHELTNTSEDIKDYEKKLRVYLEKAADLKESDLANYVVHRKIILDLLKNALNYQDDGKYERENVIHQLIMPMRKTSEDVDSQRGNLWIIDERLAFHNYLASDKTLKSMPITDSSSMKEPDIVALNIYDTPFLVNNGNELPLASITVIEIKRPMRNDFNSEDDTNPIFQAHGYLKRIREGNVKTEQGRLIPNSKDIPGFCYILCDMTPKMEECCQQASLNVTADRMGYFGYNVNFNVYTTVMSFDLLLKSANERNRAFFDKLGLPAN